VLSMARMADGEAEDFGSLSRDGLEKLVQGEVVRLRDVISCWWIWGRQGAAGGGGAMTASRARRSGWPSQTFDLLRHLGAASLSCNCLHYRRRTAGKSSGSGR